jgi:hypothetical protein
MPSWMKASAAAPVALLAIALLGGCGPKADDFAPACPDLKLLRDGADLTRFSPQGHDVTDMLLTARIVAVPASCKNGPRGTVAATMHVGVDVVRGPALPGRSAAVPYFVSILDGDRVLQQKDYTVTANFPANVDRVQVLGDQIDLLFPVSPTKTAAAYTIYVSFRLTPEELQYNRRGAAQ